MTEESSNEENWGVEADSCCQLSEGFTYKKTSTTTGSAFRGDARNTEKSVVSWSTVSKFSEGSAG